MHGVFNAVAVHGDAAGEALFYGRGAGQDPTASSVVADLVEAARSLQQSAGHRGFLPYRENGRMLPVGETSTAYYVRFDVTDRPGVIAEIARILADHRIGISGTHSPVNPANPDAEFVDMVFLLHTCPFGKLQAALSGNRNASIASTAPRSSSASKASAEQPADGPTFFRGGSQYERWEMLAMVADHTVWIQPWHGALTSRWFMAKLDNRTRDECTGGFGWWDVMNRCCLNLRATHGGIWPGMCCVFPILIRGRVILPASRHCSRAWRATSRRRAR